jgi:hypothetical protein
MIGIRGMRFLALLIFVLRRRGYHPPEPYATHPGTARQLMPLQNRVDPFGDLLAAPSRGLFMGNRGGRFHSDEKTLAARRWASRQWICCVLDFRGRRRDVWGRFYTELFFLDEVTALAAGHRPCFECRRQEAVVFAENWRKAKGLGAPPRARDMDTVLHDERLDGRAKRRHRMTIDDLPDGAFIAREEGAFAVCGETLLHWTPQGYDTRRPRPRGVTVDVLTPPSILAVLAAGYEPHWHPSANA